jgi:hypothetical protein
MATISENLQIIKNSTDAIKQAIIDKGGTIEGDITTWASAISEISEGGSGSGETQPTSNLILEGTKNINGTTITYSGTLRNIPDVTTGNICINYASMGVVHFNYVNVFSDGASTLYDISISLDVDEPLSNDTVCALYFYIGKDNIYPIKYTNLTTDPT